MLLNKTRDEIDDVLFGALRAVFQFERQKVAVFGLTFEAIYLLQFLRRKSPIRISEVAVEMKVPISTLSRTIGRLQKRGLVSRRRDPGDKRIILVSLLAKGRRIVSAVEAHSFEHITANLAAFGPEDIRSFIRTAGALGEILKTEGEGNAATKG